PQARDPGRRGRPDAGGGGLLRPAGVRATVGAHERGQRWPGAAGILVYPSEPRHPHREPAGIDAQGARVPAAVLRTGGCGRRHMNIVARIVAFLFAAALPIEESSARTRAVVASHFTIESSHWVRADPQAVWKAFVEDVDKWWPAE